MAEENQQYYLGLLKSANDLYSHWSGRDSIFGDPREGFIGARLFAEYVNQIRAENKGFLPEVTPLDRVKNQGQVSDEWLKQTPLAYVDRAYSNDYIEWLMTGREVKADEQAYYLEMVPKMMEWVRDGKLTNDQILTYANIFNGLEIGRDVKEGDPITQYRNALAQAAPAPQPPRLGETAEASGESGAKGGDIAAKKLQPSGDENRADFGASTSQKAQPWRSGGEMPNQGEFSPTESAESQPWRLGAGQAQQPQTPQQSQQDQQPLPETPEASVPESDQISPEPGDIETSQQPQGAQQTDQQTISTGESPLKTTFSGAKSTVAAKPATAQIKKGQLEGAKLSGLQQLPASWEKKPGKGRKLAQQKAKKAKTEDEQQRFQQEQMQNLIKQRRAEQLAARKRRSKRPRGTRIPHAIGGGAAGLYLANEAFAATLTQKTNFLVHILSIIFS